MAKDLTTNLSRLDHMNLLAGLITLAGFALRMFRLTYQSIWWDEAHTIFTAQQGWLAVWNLPNTVSYNHPPLHYGLMVAWTRLAGVSELAVRYPSVIFGVLLLPLTYFVTCRWFDRTTGLAAAALAASWPIYITYSQEARVYALLPVLYLWMLFLAYRIVERGKDAPVRWWMLLGGVELVALLSHNFMALAVLAINGVLLVGWLRGRRVNVAAWATCQLVGGLIFAGWVVRLLPNLHFLQADLAGSGPGTNLWVVTRRIGLFMGGGYPAADSPGGWLALVVGVVGAVSGSVLVAELADGRHRRIAWVLLEGLGPLAVALAIFWWAPQTQPRYLIALTIPLIVALAAACVRLLQAHGWRRALGGAAVLSLAALCAAGWAEATFDPVTFKDDARGAAVYLERTSDAGDVILTSPNDDSVAYYYTGLANILYTSDQGLEEQTTQILAVAQPGKHVYLADWESSTADRIGLRNYLLERAGRLTYIEDLHGIDVWAYIIDRPVEGIPSLADSAQQVGLLTLTGYQIDAYTTNDDAVTAVLRWRLDRPDRAEYRVSVRLVDGQGMVIAANDRTLLNEDNRTTSNWQAQEEVLGFVVLPVPVGWLPGEYRLQVRVYNAASGMPLTWSEGGTDWTLPESVTLVAGTDFATDAYGTWKNTNWQTVDPPLAVGGVTLTRVAFDPAQGLPGKPISALLWWQVDGPERTDSLAAIELTDGNRVWSEAEPTVTAAGLPAPDYTTVAVERRWLTYPPVRGPVVLRTAGGMVLGSVSLNADGLTWTLPRMDGRIGARFGEIGTLAGYDLSARRVRAGDPLTVTLIWQAADGVATGRPYTVFSQLLTADGRLIAQHDGPPVDGSRPTTGWVSGEVIADAHTLEWRDTSYSGVARLIVGLYDSESIERVLTDGGADYVEIRTIQVLSAED